MNIFKINIILAILLSSLLFQQPQDTQKDLKYLMNLKILSLDSLTFECYYFYTCENLDDDKPIELVVSKTYKNDKCKIFNDLVIGDSVKIEIWKISSFQIHKGTYIRVDHRPIGSVRFNVKKYGDSLQLKSINNYGTIYTTNNLYGYKVLECR